MKQYKYQVVARIVKDVTWLDTESVFGPLSTEERAGAVVTALAGREDCIAARIEPLEVELPAGEDPPPPPDPGRRPC